LRLPVCSGSRIQPVTTSVATTMPPGMQADEVEDGFRDDRSVSEKPLHW